MNYSLPGSSVWDFPCKNTGVACHALLKGIFPTQGSPATPVFQADSLLLSQQGSPHVRITTIITITFLSVSPGAANALS